MTPRFMVTSVDLFMPVIFITWLCLKLPVRYSDTVTSMPMPLNSWKPAFGPEVSPVPRSTRKLNWTYGRSLNSATAHASSDFAVGRPLADAEDDELGRTQRGDADQADQPPVIEVVLRHRRAVALDEVGLLRSVAEQRAVHPFVE